MRGCFAAIVLGAALVALTAGPARAQDRNIELGTSLASATIALGDERSDTNSFGVPASGFGFPTPSVYTSFFVTPRLAIGPRISFGWSKASCCGSSHFVNLAAQVDYFLRNKNVESPYVFGTVGVLDNSGENNPTSVGAGVGYRILAGGRLTFRVDGRFVHFSDDVGDSLSFGLSIGGLF